MALAAGAELGATNDPKALVVGDKAAVAERATAILDEQRRIGSLLETIESLAVPTWEGGFGKAGYVYEMDQEASKFGAYRDTLKSMGTSLNTYADALGTAQNRAQDAIDKWNEGEAATKKALSEHNAAVDGYNGLVAAHNSAIKSGQTVPPIGLAHPGAFVDPGEALRQEAKEILADAREQLDSAGSTATNPPAQSSSSGSGEGSGPTWFKGGKFKFPGAEDSTGLNPRDLADYPDGDSRSWGDAAGEDGEEEGNSKKPSVNAEVSVVSGDAKASVLSAEGKSEGKIGDLEGKAGGSVDVLTVGAGGEVKVGTDGVAASGQVNAHLVHAKGEASVDYGPIGAHAKGEAYVGAEAKASVGIGKNGIHAGGEAFAGAKITGEVGGDVGGVGAGVEAEAWAGVGVAADLDVGMKDGKFTLGGELGAGLGIGAKIGPNVTLDFPKMAETGQDIAEDAGKVVDQVTVSPSEVADAGKSIAKGVGGLFS
ncbi:MAG: putative T7SS-secreted protein [Nocardioides sp.]|uniref:putative T7SS-secreted protein n=1 Tax=Nocardioides sp. TaxID=35761 RepID=UPI003D6AF0A4